MSRHTPVRSCPHRYIMMHVCTVCGENYHDEWLLVAHHELFHTTTGSSERRRQENEERNTDAYGFEEEGEENGEEEEGYAEEEEEDCEEDQTPVPAERHRPGNDLLIEPLSGCILS